MRIEGGARFLSILKEARRPPRTGLKPLLARMISLGVEANSIRPRLFPIGKCCSWQREAAFTGCEKSAPLLLSFRAKRGISLILGFNPREIPRFARNDKINYLFRSLFSEPGELSFSKLRR